MRKLTALLPLILLVSCAGTDHGMLHLRGKLKDVGTSFRAEYVLETDRTVYDLDNPASQLAPLLNHQVEVDATQVRPAALPVRALLHLRDIRSVD